MTDLKVDDPKPKEVEATPEAEAPPPAVVELILRPLADGHHINLAAKVAQPDGTVVDTVVESTNLTQELRIPLVHLQEAIVRAKVISVMTHDAAQSANVQTPYEGVDTTPPPTYEGPPPDPPVGRKDPDETRVDHERGKTRHDTHSSSRR